MRHARPEALARLEPMLVALRTIDGLQEKKPGVFYRRTRAFLHFHEDPSGLHADVRSNDDFERFRVETDDEQRQLVRRIASAFG